VSNEYWLWVKVYAGTGTIEIADGAE